MNKNALVENISKCSRCGLCSGVCPMFSLLKTEGASCRGKLMQILGLSNGDLKLNKKILKNLDLCLGCEKCALNCPSGVNTVDVIFSQKKLTPLGRFLNSIFVFNLKMLALSAFSFFKKQPFYNKNSDIVFFEGCISKKLKIPFKLKNLELKNGKFNCCGLPYLAKGREDLYLKMAIENENIIENAKMVVFDCATCFSTVKKYPFKNPKNKEKLVFYTDFLKNSTFLSKKFEKITYHMPCHLVSAGVSIKEIEEILSNIKNAKYERHLGFDDCCGFSGDFFLRHPILSYRLSIKKAKNIMKTSPSVVLTSCPTCIWSLKFSLFVYSILNRKKTPKVFDMANFIMNNCEIAPKKQIVSEILNNEKELIKV